MATENGLKRYDGEKVVKLSFNDSIDDNFVYTAYLPNEDALLCLSYFGRPIWVDVSSTKSDPIVYKTFGDNHPQGFYNSVILTPDNVCLQYPDKTNIPVINYSNGKTLKSRVNYDYSYLIYQSPKAKYLIYKGYLVKFTSQNCDTLYKLKSFENHFTPKVIDMRARPEFVFFDNGKLMKLDLKNDQVTELYRTKDISLLDINSMGSDANGNTWVYTKKGALLINHNGEAKWILPGLDINSGFMDRNKQWFWLSTFDHKLFKIPVSETLSHLTLNSKIDYIFSTTPGLCYITNNKLFIVNEQNQHEELFDYTNTNLVKQSIQNVIIEGNKLFICGKNCLLFACREPFSFAGPGPSKNSIRNRKYYYTEELTAIKGITSFGPETYYLAARNSLFKVKFNDTKLFFENISNLNGVFKNLVAKNDTLYFTKGKDIVELKLSTGKIRTIASFHSDIKKLIATKSELFAAFSSKGIVRITDTKKYMYNTANSSLISDEITDIQNSKNGVWINTQDGLQLAIVKDSIVQFYKPEFLRSKDILFTIHGSYCYLLDKNSANILSSFKTNVSNTANTPQLYIDLVKSNMKEILDELPSLPYLNNYLSITVGAIGFDNLKNKYFYQLNTDADSGSFRPMEGNTLNLRSIESGKYHLKFICKNINGASSKVLHYSFAVERPYWELLWFRVSLSAVLAGITALLISLYYNKKNKHNKERFESDYKILQLEQQLFRSLMNPHFIFNTLNSIQALINNNKQQEAANNIGVFSQLVRKNLEDSLEGFCTLGEELTRLKLYVEMENLRFNNCIEFLLEKDPALNENTVKIPAFILQPLVENSILHGIRPNKSGLVKINISKESDRNIKIDVIDDGVGLYNSLKKLSKIEKKSVALSLIGSRFDKLSKIQKRDYKFNIEDRTEVDGKTGTICTLILPFEHT